MAQSPRREDFKFGGAADELGQVVVRNHAIWVVSNADHVRKTIIPQP